MYIPTTVQVEGHSNFLKNVFGVDSVQQIQPELVSYTFKISLNGHFIKRNHA